MSCFSVIVLVLVWFLLSILCGVSMMFFSMVRWGKVFYCWKMMLIFCCRWLRLVLWVCMLMLLMWMLLCWIGFRLLMYISRVDLLELELLMIDSILFLFIFRLIFLIILNWL